jgi:hypothetical protein
MYEPEFEEDEEKCKFQLSHVFLATFWFIGIVGTFFYVLVNLGILLMHMYVKLFPQRNNFHFYLIFIDYSVFFGGPIILFAFGGLVTHGYLFNDHKLVYIVNYAFSWCNFLGGVVSLVIFSIVIFFTSKIDENNGNIQYDLFPLEMDAIVLLVWGSLYIIQSKNYFQKKFSSSTLKTILMKKSIVISLFWWTGMISGFFLESVLLFSFIHQHRDLDPVKFIYLVPLVFLLEFASCAGLAMKSVHHSKSKNKIYLFTLIFENFISILLILFQLFKVIYLLVTHKVFSSDVKDYIRKNSIQNWYILSNFALLFCKLFSFLTLLVSNSLIVYFGFKKKGKKSIKKDIQELLESKPTTMNENGNYLSF